jgi:hypothetical protein
MRMVMFGAAAFLTTGCVSTVEVGKTSPMICNQIEAIDYHYCTPEKGDGSRKYDDQNLCDTPETVERIIRYNTKYQSACEED